MIETDSMKRLEAFEKMLSSIQSQYADMVGKIAKMKADGREKSVTFKQLLGNKLRLLNMLSIYRLYGLTEINDDKEVD